MRKMQELTLPGVFLLLTILLTPIYSRAADYHLATTGDDSNAGTLEAWVVNPSSRSSPEPVGRVINVATFGVDLADNDVDDTGAVSAAIASAGDNCTLYFPKGVYNVRWVRKIEKVNSLSIKGDGPTESILKRMGPFWREGLTHTYKNLQASYATDCKILMIKDCRNMCIRDIGFNANGTPTFGGVGIQRPKDSTLPTPGTSIPRSSPRSSEKTAMHGASWAMKKVGRISGLRTISWRDFKWRWMASIE